MAIYNLKQTLREHGQAFLVLDFNHLFVASTLREEVWLLRGRNDEAFIKALQTEAADFNMTAISCDRDWDSFSGGEKTIWACLLMLALIRFGEYRGIKVLAINILESLSEGNRFAMLQKFATLHLSHQLSLFTLQADHLEEFTLALENTNDAAT